MNILSALVGEFPRGTLCALTGTILVLCYYLWVRKQALCNPARFRASTAYPMSDSRFFTGRPYLLIGISLTVVSILVASVADGIAKDSDWTQQLFLAVAASAGFATVLVACLYVLRHWREALADFREPPPDYFRTLTENPDSSERYSWAQARIPLLKKSLWMGGAFAVLIFIASKLGASPDRLLENPLVRFIAEHVWQVAIRHCWSFFGPLVAAWLCLREASYSCCFL